MSINILFVGDIYGRSGREALQRFLPELKQDLKPDIVIVNGENAANGRGITRKIANQFYDWGTDCITTGNHIWSQKEIMLTIDQDQKLIRPINFPPNTPGNGHYIHKLPDGRTILIINAMGRLFMDPMDDPFRLVNELVEKHPLKKNVDAIFVDFHGEVTSEKMAFAHYLDGKVSAVIGTHTHIPTADYHVMSGGTAFQCDAGMTGDYDSVIGAQKDVPVARFTKKIMLERLSPANGEATLCGNFIKLDEKTGLAQSIIPIRRGGVLSQA